MKVNFTKHLFTVAMVLGVSMLYGQYSPSHSTDIVVTENTGTTLTNYQIRLVVNTQALVTAGDMESDGSDIRFSDASCSGSAVYYEYWIESGMNTNSTVIWVLMPSLPASSSQTIYMLYGDPTASPGSDFNATFPNAVVTAGTSTTLTGTNNVGWIDIGMNDTLYVGAGSVLDLRARYAKIDGVIYGKGAGYQAPTSGPTAGNGPGGGQAGTSSGAGGGAYGGNGGIGGYDSGDPINAGGTAYGNNNMPTIDMGSSGGTPSSVIGGNGGGAIILLADYIEVNGEINMDGNDGEMPGAGQGGGGGAGGGMLLLADSLLFSGTMTASGGGGSIGTSTANDDGGGGGGGRIKLFHDALFSNTGTTLVNGGPGGINGGTGTGDPGAVGTLYDQSTTFITETYTVGSSTPIATGNPVPDVANLQPDTSSCSANPTPPTATDGCGYTINGVPDVTFPITTTGTTTVTWTYDSNGNTATQTQDIVVIDSTAPVPDAGTLADLTGDCSVMPTTPTASDNCGGTINGVPDVALPVTTNGTTVITWTYDDGNGNVVTQTQNVTVNTVDQTVSQSGATLTANETGATYQWLDCDNGFAPIAGETNQSFTATAITGSYAVQLTGSTCVDTSACITIDFTKLNEEGKEFGLTIYPNPASTTIEVKGLSQVAHPISAQITDISGAVVMNVQGTENTIDISSLTEGVYFYKLIHEDGYELIKFIKQ